MKLGCPSCSPTENNHKDLSLVRLVAMNLNILVRQGFRQRHYEGSKVQHCWCEARHSLVETSLN
jgi:hypothetical protein